MTTVLTRTRKSFFSSTPLKKVELFQEEKGLKGCTDTDKMCGLPIDTDFKLNQSMFEYSGDDDLSQTGKLSEMGQKEFVKDTEEDYIN